MSALAEGTLTVQIVHDASRTRLVASGEIDAASARTFDAAAAQALAEHPECLDIDLTDVDFLDSSGLRSIIALTNKTRDRRIHATVSGMSPAARRVLEITGLIEMLRRS